jgi:uncharacterized protein (TIGR03790 family)
LSIGEPGDLRSPAKYLARRFILYMALESPVSEHRPFVRFLIAAMVLCVVIGTGPSALALQPDEILLITNKNSGDSQTLAQLYCQLRNVPADQIVSLDLPADEEMSFETYETGVVGPVRQFLTDHRLKTKIKCLLTFYGVPFRIRAKQNTPAEDLELGELRDVRSAAGDELQKTVERLETLTTSVEPTFSPNPGNSVNNLLARANAAALAVSSKLSAITDAAKRLDVQGQFLKLLEAMGGDTELDNWLKPTPHGESTGKEQENSPRQQLHQDVMDARVEIQKLQAIRWDATARSQLRQFSRAHFGVVGLLRVVEAQISYLTPGDTASATDNELALLWLDYYPRQHWLGNPLNLMFGGRASNVLMVMRLDGPDPATVERMMRTSVQVEKTGLNGVIAIDARGIAPIDDKGNISAYGEFDETLRHLALVLRTKTRLKIVLDDQDIVFPPHFVKNVACYCGWYSVANYIPGCDFNPGAVGYHIASYEMVTLHTASSRWVRGLLIDGVVATLGAVAEPTLAAFPKPDEFFPLLLTGKLTLAEVYWKTNPMTSWMISFIGDPLYTPYKLHPAMAIEDLPPLLRKALQ